MDLLRFYRGEIGPDSMIGSAGSCDGADGWCQPKFGW